MFKLENISDKQTTTKHKISCIFEIAENVIDYLEKLGMEYSYSDWCFNSSIEIKNTIYHIKLFREDNKCFIRTFNINSKQERVNEKLYSQVLSDRIIKLYDIIGLLYYIEYYFTELKKEEIKSFNNFVDTKKLEA